MRVPINQDLCVSEDLARLQISDDIQRRAPVLTKTSRESRAEMVEKFTRANLTVEHLYFLLYMFRMTSCMHMTRSQFKKVGTLVGPWLQKSWRFAEDELFVWDGEASCHWRSDASDIAAMNPGLDLVCWLGATPRDQLGWDALFQLPATAQLFLSPELQTVAEQGIQKHWDIQRPEPQTEEQAYLDNQWRRDRYNDLCKDKCSLLRDVPVEGYTEMEPKDSVRGYCRAELWMWVVMTLEKKGRLGGGVLSVPGFDLDGIPLEDLQRAARRMFGRDVVAVEGASVTLAP